MVKENKLCEISIEDFERLNDLRIGRRMSKQEFLKEFEQAIDEWLMRNEKNIEESIGKYSWRDKDHEESIRVRNELEHAIMQSRQKNNGGIDLETLDKICRWGFGKIFPLRDKEKVIEITQKAFSYVDKRDYYNAAKTLMSISGVNISTATKIIGLSNQSELAIYDSRVGHALRSLRKNSAKVILCPRDRGYKRDYDQTSKNGWAINYERLIWTLQKILEHFNKKAPHLRIADIEMALFVLGK